MTIDTNLFLDTVMTMLAQGAENIPVPVSGTSMSPFLHPGDTVFLNTLSEEPKPGDIILFQRPNGRYILHRVMKVKGDTIWFLGDAQTVREPINRDQLRAIASAALVRGQRLYPDSCRWKLYAFSWRHLAPLRPAIGKLHFFLHSRNPR